MNASDGARPPGSLPQATPDPVRTRRDRLQEAMQSMAQIGTPPVGQTDPWRTQLLDAAIRLRDLLDQHVTDTEQPGGFFDDLMTETTGRLRGQIELLRREHTELATTSRDLIDGIEQARDPESLHDAAQQLLDGLDQHRQLGANLLWEAYGVDLGQAD